MYFLCETIIKPYFLPFLFFNGRIVGPATPAGACLVGPGLVEIDAYGFRHSGKSLRKTTPRRTMTDAATTNAPAQREEYARTVAVLGPGCSGLVCQQQAKGNLAKFNSRIQ